MLVDFNMSRGVISQYSNGDCPPGDLPMDDFTIDYYKHYIAGGISGMCGILLSHPVDTIKTHIQTGKPLGSFNWSLGNLYRGIQAPLAGVAIEKAIVFGTYNYCRANLGWNTAAAGGLSGFMAALVVSPYERWKIIRQTGGISNGGGITSLFRGLSATFTREIPGFAIYFSIYEGLKVRTEGMNNRRINYLESFIYGGLSGCGAWIFIYPQDRIKTIIQSNTGTESSNGTGAKVSIRYIISEIYNAGGLRHFYSGFSWAVMRALLLHSGTFCMMEVISSYHI